MRSSLEASPLLCPLVQQRFSDDVWPAHAPSRTPPIHIFHAVRVQELSTGPTDALVRLTQEEIKSLRLHLVVNFNDDDKLS